MKTRRIDCRLKPPVKGVDLWHALNYIALDDVSVDFIYNSYTSGTVIYTPGSRPKIETIARRFRAAGKNTLERSALLAVYVASTVPWAGYYHQKNGKRLPLDRNLSEEQLLRSSYAWCNEQARIYCALTQICGIPSRLVFASNPKLRHGHVISEVLTHRGWMAVDQSFGYCFVRAGRPVNAWEIWHKPEMRSFFRPKYHKLCLSLKEKLGCEILAAEFNMSVAPDPLAGFSALGYCNHQV